MQLGNVIVKTRVDIHYILFQLRISDCTSINIITDNNIGIITTIMYTLLIKV